MPTWFKRVTHVSIKVSVNLNVPSHEARYLQLDTLEMKVHAFLFIFLQSNYFVFKSNKTKRKHLFSCFFCKGKLVNITLNQRVCTDCIRLKEALVTI